MFIVKKGFSGKVSGNKNQILDIKDKNIVKDLLRAGYIEEYSEKNQSNSELKKENETLKKTIESLETENASLKEELANLVSIDDKSKDQENEEPGNPGDEKTKTDE